MSQNTTHLQLEDLPELKAHLINKAKRDGIVLLTVVFWDIRASRICVIFLKQIQHHLFHS